jgi:hypothetical protein
VSAAGSRVTIDDRADHLSVRVATPSGRSVTLEDVDGRITIDGGSGATIVITPVAIEISCPGEVKLMTSMAEITAATLEVNCATVRTSGLLRCQTLVADSVISGSYSPGAGNVW